VVSRYYIYGEGLVSQIDAAGNSHYYHFDPTGHTLALTDASGNVTDKYAYAPYGFTTVDGVTPNPFKYVGRHGVMDDGNGLHYMRARYYSEEIKRFMSLDGLHGDMINAQALNRYAYVLGNPVSFIDASGLAAKSYGWHLWGTVSSIGDYAYKRKHYVKYLYKLPLHVKKSADKVLTEVPVDLARVYIGDPAQGAIDACTKDIEMESRLDMKALGCASGSILNIAGASLDVFNPINIINVSIRTPIREIAGGDKQFEKELQDVANLVIGLGQIRKLTKNLIHARIGLIRSKKAVRTIMAKVNKRGLAGNQAQYAYYSRKYHELLLGAMSFINQTIKVYTSYGNGRD